MPFLGGKTGFFLAEKQREQKEKQQKTKKKQKQIK